ncbi:MAG: hypothetical protein ACLSHO_05040 [Dysosmobacter sp.]
MMYAVLSLGLALLGGLSVWRRCYGCPYRCCTGHWLSQYSARGIWSIPLWRTAFSVVLVGLAALSWVVTLIRAVRGDDLVK